VGQITCGAFSSVHDGDMLFSSSQSRDPGPLPGEPSREKETAAAPNTVLVVDDDTDTRLSICELLSDSGYIAVGLQGGQEALDYLKRETPPACVVLDLWMPNVDGWTVAREVLEGALPRVPIVVVTAAPSYFSYPVPAGLVMRKPVNPDRLLATLGQALAPSRRD
jgi:CheY-like chemotaxis protein